MKRKLYELVGLMSGRFTTRYMGVDVTLNFEPKGRRGQLITDCQFVQDAIEADPKFGPFFILKQEWDLEDGVAPAGVLSEEESGQVVQQFEVRQKKVKTRAEIYAENQAKLKAEQGVGEPEKAEGDAPLAVGEPLVVKNVKGIRDAAKWFEATYGEQFADMGELMALCEKHNVKFPNFKQ